MKIRIEAAQGGERIDAYLARRIPELTRSAAQRAILSGGVTLLDVPVRKNRPVQEGEEYEVSLPEPEEPRAEAQEIPLDVVYEDADIIVVNKPRGMVTHPAPGNPDRTLVNALLYHCGGSLSGVGGEKRPGIVHRLDKDTSGLIIAAKNDFAHTRLAAQLKDRSLSREYEAVVLGRVREEAGTVDVPIGRHPTERKRHSAVSRAARSAVTRYEVVARYNGYTHIRCRLLTGRTHQIRVHMAHIGHPVLGDLVYGRRKPEKGLAGQCLHARRLRFAHPRTGEPVELEAALPGYFTEVLGKLGPEM